MKIDEDDIQALLEDLRMKSDGKYAHTINSIWWWLKYCRNNKNYSAKYLKLFDAARRACNSDNFYDLPRLWLTEY